MVFLGAVSGFCGYVITEADGTRAMVSEGMIKSVFGDTEGETVIMDLNKGQVIMLNDDEKTVTIATMDDL